MKNEGGSLWREKKEEEDWLYWTQSSHWRMRYIGGTKEKEEEMMMMIHSRVWHGTNVIYYWRWMMESGVPLRFDDGLATNSRSKVVIIRRAMILFFSHSFDYSLKDIAGPTGKGK
jgi:hypothetical protein